MDHALTTPASTKHELFTREYNLGDLLTLAWKLFSDNFKAILIITLIVYIPINVIAAFTPAPAYSESDSIASIWTNTISSTGFAVSSLLTMLAGVLVPMAIAFIIKNSLDGQATDYQTALKRSVARWLPGIGTTLLMIIFLIGLFIPIIPGFIFLIYWSFAAYIVILNNKSGLGALKYSKQVVNGRWWKTLGYLVVFGLISGMVSWVVNTPLVSFADNAMISFISSTISDIIFSFVIVASVLLFLNLETNRKLTANSISQS